MQDPVDGAPAVLVKLYNVTQQKHMEAELQTQKEALARFAFDNAVQLSACCLWHAVGPSQLNGINDPQ